MLTMYDYSISEVHRLYSQKKLTSVDLTQQYLDRIAQIDQSGPQLNAFIEINPDALLIAKKCDEFFNSQGFMGPLHGIPFVLKDNIATDDAMQTTAGSLAMEGYYSDQDAFLVSRLRQAGGILLGKTNLSEWANFRASHSTSGWSSRGGQTKNPYILDRSPCGSSSGSAVAVAADLCLLAIGTETDGSITCPASVNSIVGLKPTVGLISRSGIVPIAHSQDTAGPMAKTVQDVAIAFGVLTGIDSQDSGSHGLENHILHNYIPFLDKNALQGTKLGVARSFMGYNPHVDKLFTSVCKLLIDFGVELVDPIAFSLDEDIGDAEFEVLLYEFKHDLNRFLAQTNESCLVKSLEEVIQYNKEHAKLVMPYFQQEVLEMAQKKGDLNDQVYLDAQEKCLKASREEGIDKVMEEHQLDAIIAPTGPPAWSIDLVNGDHHTGSCSQPAAIAGYPHITIPMGYIYELPVGLSFFGSAFTEGKLLGLAYSCEQLLNVRKSPQFQPSLQY